MIKHTYVGLTGTMHLDTKAISVVYFQHHTLWLENTKISNVQTTFSYANANYTTFLLTAVFCYLCHSISSFSVPVMISIQDSTVWERAQSPRLNFWKFHTCHEICVPRSYLFSFGLLTCFSSADPAWTVPMLYFACFKTQAVPPSCAIFYHGLCWFYYPSSWLLFCFVS